MNERSYMAAERALMNLLKKTRKRRDYFKGRLIKAADLPLPKQHMVVAAYENIDRYDIDILELEGELEMLREELVENTEQEEGSVGEEEDQEQDKG